MSEYKLVPVEKLKEWEAAINTIALQVAFDIADDIAQYYCAPSVQVEPVGWQFYLDGTWWDGGNLTKQQRKNMEEAGVRVRDVYAAPQQADQQPVSWIRIRGGHVILSRCDWMYPASTEDSAGPRDEQRFAAVGRRDGDIVLPAPEGALDREDMKTMLTWPNSSKPAEQKPAPDVSTLVEALTTIRAMFPAKIDKQSFVVNGGTPVRSDDDDEFYSVKKVNALVDAIVSTVDGSLAAHRKEGEK